MYTLMVNPNEGAALKFILTFVVNGVKYANIDKVDVNPEIVY